MKLTPENFFYLASLCLEGFCFGEIFVLPLSRQVSKEVTYSFLTPVPGLYSGVFVLHLQLEYHATDKTKQNIIFYALCVLYVLSVVVMALDIANFVIAVTTIVSSPTSTFFQLRANQLCSPLTSIWCTAFLSLFSPQYLLAATLLPNLSLYAQPDNAYPSNLFILSSKIHRCWIVWGCNTRVVIIPLLLAFAFLGPSIYLDSLVDLNLSLLVMWIASVGSGFIAQGGIYTSAWGNTLILTSLSASMTVNALVTGLIVFRIFRVFRVAKNNTTLDEKYLGVTGGSKLRSIMFIIIESGMALFAIQFARLVVTATGISTNTKGDILNLMIRTHEMLNVIINISHWYLIFY